jgi:hypothetical protein
MEKHLASINPVTHIGLSLLSSLGRLVEKSLFILLLNFIFIGLFLTSLKLLKCKFYV